jgi:hypothetical protein
MSKSRYYTVFGSERPAVVISYQQTYNHCANGPILA